MVMTSDDTSKGTTASPDSKTDAKETMGQIMDQDIDCPTLIHQRNVKSLK